MPKRRSGESYWTEAQFLQLQQASAGDLSSRGQLPWRLLAYLFGKQPHVQPIRDLVGRRLLTPKGIEEAQRDLNRMLITLWTAGYIELDPKPRAAGLSRLHPTPLARRIGKEGSVGCPSGIGPPNRIGRPIRWHPQQDAGRRRSVACGIRSQTTIPR